MRSYPIEPPQMRFVTPVYHPNIDAGGRICLSVLKTGDKARSQRSHGALLCCQGRALRRSGRVLRFAGRLEAGAERGDGCGALERRLRDEFAPRPPLTLRCAARAQCCKA